MNNRRATGIFVFLLLVSACLFTAFNGRVHLYDWDEINFAESAREMMVTGDYSTVRIDFQPFWEKPPLFIWMQVISMKMFGVDEFGARFPNTISGILTLLLLFFAGKKYSGARFGLLWAIAYACSLLPFLYFKSGLIDPWFNLFIFAGLLCFIFYLQEKTRIRWLVLSAVGIGLAVMTKGPVALLLSLLSAFLFFLFKRFRDFVRFRAIMIWTGVFVITGGLWFLLIAIDGRAQTVADFISYQVRLFRTEDAGHGGFPLYHAIILLMGVFPASVIAIPSFVKNRATGKEQKDFRKWMLVLFWTVLILFTIVRTKIVHYSSLCYFPLTFLAALEADYLIVNTKLFSRAVFILAITILSSWLLFSVTAPVLLGPFKQELLNLLSGVDPASHAMLSAEVAWPWYTYIPAFVLAAMLAMLCFTRKKSMAPLLVLSAGSFIYINTAIWLFTVRVECYSQQANIEFFKGLEGKDVYTRTLGIKSYGRLFYTDARPSANINSNSKNWQLFGPVDKPVYCSFSLNNKKQYLKKYYNLELLYEKNGYVFCIRNPEKTIHP
jgi:4-amino-4-deoxy-L-arabinose transferase-like glycosyltransferase